MAFSTQSNFSAALDGVTVRDINKKIDYRKTKLAERKQVIDSILNETKFYEEYFSEYFKANINCGDPLSSNVNVCRSLEKMANYLLTSDEIKEEEDKDKVQYVFHTDRRYFQQKMDREKKIESITKSKDDNHSDEIIHFLKRTEPNSKKPKTQSISPHDLKRKDFLGDVLRSYDSLLKFCSEELKKNDSPINRYILTKTKGSVHSDMIYSKDHLLGVWGYDYVKTPESTKYDIDVFDFTNAVHLKGGHAKYKRIKNGKEVIEEIPVKGLIFFKPEFDPNDDFSFILLDLQKTIEQANLTDEELYVLDQLRNGATQEEIAFEIGTYQKRISRMIDTIVHKIIKVGNKYDKAEAK